MPENEKIDATDMLALQLAAARCETAQAQLDATRLRLRLKYGLAEEDEIDNQTLHIRRAKPQESDK